MSGGSGYPPQQASSIPEIAADAVLVKSEKLTSATVVGYDFNSGVDYDALMKSYMTTGFQATNLAKAFEEVDKMLNWSLADEPVAKDEEEEFKEPEKRKKVRTKIWLSYTSNLISSGLRESIRFLVQHSMVQVMISTAGGIEEDIIKCLAPTHLGDFAMEGLGLRRRGINRIGNLLAPNDNYCLFEDWMTGVLDRMHDEQEKDGIVWTPSKMIHRFGKEIDKVMQVVLDACLLALHRRTSLHRQTSLHRLSLLLQHGLPQEAARSTSG